MPLSSASSPVRELGPMCGQYFHFLRFAPTGNDYSVSRYRTQVTRVFEVAEERLGKVSYLGGAEFSIADITWLPWARFLPFLLGPTAPEKFPTVTAWAEKLSARPAVELVPEIGPRGAVFSRSCRLAIR
jgi:GST-like protein